MSRPFITSSSNPRLKAIRRLRRAPRRNGNGLFVIEGQRQLAAALEADARVRELYAAIAETSTRWGGSVPDLEAFIDRGLVLCGTAPSRERALLLAARAFAVRRDEHATDEDWEHALDTAREALAIAEGLGELREVSLCLDAVGYAERELARFADALRTHERRVPIARTLRESDELIDALTMVAQSQSAVASLADAIKNAKEAREIARATGKDALRLAATSEEAKARLFTSDFEGALALGTELLREAPREAGADALGYAIAAAAAMGDPIEQQLQEHVMRLELPATTVAAQAVVASFYGMRPDEIHFAQLAQLATVADVRRRWHPIRRVMLLPLFALAAVRWGVEAPLLDVAEDVSRRGGHRRGEALVAHARALAGADALDLRSRYVPVVCSHRPHGGRSRNGSPRLRCR
jgi:tetratricopeptide (TPR) repeat protein